MIRPQIGSQISIMKLLHVPAVALALTAATTHAAEAPQSYYIEAGTYATQRESDPPGYVGHPAGLEWLDVGLQHRLRYEYHDDDLRRASPSNRDEPLLQRTRLYLGVRSKFDPLRFAVEFQDSRRHNSQYAPDVRDVDKTDFIQGFVELHYPSMFGSDARGNARPLSIRVGRHSFEALDRRLIGRNEWRNTSNSHDGIRISLGQEHSDWQLELMSLRPVTRLLTAMDKPNQDQRFDVVIGHLRSLSPKLILEPHYMRLKQKASASNNLRERDIHAPGLRIYGRVNEHINYDVSAMYQFGDDGPEKHRAQSFTAETGYTWTEHPWRPRLSVFYGYASGDEDPNDDESNRFERFFGFARPWSPDDYAVYENLHAPKIRLEFQPIPGVRMDVGYSGYWLASDTDRFNNLMGGSGNRDVSGQSGNEIGHGFDGRVRFALGEHIESTIGYSHFYMGTFVQNRQRAVTGSARADSDFFYWEVVFSLF